MNSTTSYTNMDIINILYEADCFNENPLIHQIISQNEKEKTAPNYDIILDKILNDDFEMFNFTEMTPKNIRLINNLLNIYVQTKNKWKNIYQEHINKINIGKYSVFEYDTCFKQIKELSNHIINNI
jgi:hypothetical protein